MVRDSASTGRLHGDTASREGPVLVSTHEGNAALRPCNNACLQCLFDPDALGATRFDRIPLGRDVIIAGYEPLVDRRVFARMRAVRAAGGRVAALVTNGRLCVYEEVVVRLRDAGVGLVVVALFGATETEHDARTRVPGSFEQAIAGIRRLRAAGQRVAITFPLLPEPATPCPDGTQPYLDLAYRLTNTGPVVLTRGPHGAMVRPLQVGTIGEKRVPDHPGGWRYDAMVLTPSDGRAGDGRGGPSDDSGLFGPPLLPMVHVPLGTQCNNRCLYCNVRGGDDPGLHERSYIEALLEHAARTFLRPGPTALPQAPDASGGHAAMDFIGGEPTLHPDLPDLIARARDLGFSWITVCTNGRELSRKGFLDRIVASGLNGVRFSMHDHRADHAGTLAGRPEAGDHYLATARLLLARTDVVPYFYRILLASNLDGLGDHLRWLAAYNRTDRPVRVHLGLPSQRGRMYENPWLFPPLIRVRPVVREAVALAADLGVEVTLFHAPACLLPDRPDLSACLHVETLQVDAGTDTVVRLQFEGDAHQEAACNRCSRRGRCPGLPRYYHDSDPEAAAAWPIPFDAA